MPPPQAFEKLQLVEEQDSENALSLPQEGLGRVGKRHRAQQPHHQNQPSAMRHTVTLSDFCAIPLLIQPSRSMLDPCGSSGVSGHGRSVAAQVFDS